MSLNSMDLGFSLVPCTTTPFMMLWLRRIFVRTLSLETVLLTTQVASLSKRWAFPSMAKMCSPTEMTRLNSRYGLWVVDLELRLLSCFTFCLTLTWWTSVIDFSWDSDFSFDRHTSICSVEGPFSFPATTFYGYSCPKLLEQSDPLSFRPPYHQTYYMLFANVLNSATNASIVSCSWFLLLTVYRS